ncbi:MAG: hypothetical protein QM727_00005 [Niabella sp.]
MKIWKEGHGACWPAIMVQGVLPTSLSRYPPNSDDAPKKAHKKDVVLVIASSQLPSDAEKTALETYWTTIWKIMGNAGRNNKPLLS